MAKERNRTISVNMAKSGGHYKIIVSKNQKVLQIHRIKDSINFKQIFWVWAIGRHQSVNVPEYD